MTKYKLNLNKKKSKEEGDFKVENVCTVHLSRRCFHAEKWLMPSTLKAVLNVESTFIYGSQTLKPQRWFNVEL